MTPFAERRARLRAAVEDEGGVFVSNATPDIRYYTGCMDAGDWLVVDDRGVWLLVNAHDAPQAIAEADDVEIEIWTPGALPVTRLIGRLAGTKRLAAPDLPLSVAESLRPKRILLTPGLTSDLRRVKEPDELDIIRRAARIVEGGMAAAKAALRPGVRELDVAAEAERAMRALGADGRIFETKIESGPRCAMPSTYASERRIERGDLVLIDIGPTFRGYFGDLTRTFSIGEPSEVQRDLLELTLAAQEHGIAEICAGVTGDAVDRAVRETIRNAGLGDAFLHATGHTVGLAGDSIQLLAPNSTSPLRAGECVTVEPGVYVLGTGGVRIEDEVLVTGGGFEMLTSFDKRLDSLVVDA